MTKPAIERSPLTSAGSPPDEGLNDQIAAAWASLLPASDAIADDITLSLMESDKAWYDEVSPELRVEIRASIREHVRRGLRTMAGLAHGNEKAIHIWRDTGRRRARQGVPLELVLNAYSLGSRVLWEALLRQNEDAGSGVDERVLVAAGQQIWAALDVQNATMLKAYHRESATMQRRDLQRQVRLLDGLVEGRAGDPDFATEAREAFGLGSDEPVACVVARFDGALEEPLRSPEERLGRSEISSFWHVRGGVYFGLVPLVRITVAELVELLTPRVAGRVGVAPSFEGLGGFASAYQLASRAAETLPRGAQQVVTVTERLPEVLLGGNPEVTSLLIAKTVGPLLAQPPQQTDVLLQTLRALLAHDGSPTHAAEQLFCHRNTVIYRLKQIESLTGRSLADPRDKLLLSLALIAIDL